MKRTGWLRKALWITPLVLLVVLGVGLIALRGYLSSQRAAQRVAEQLQEMLGGRVEVGSAQIGLVGNSHVHEIQAFEDGNSNKPWLSIDDVNADVSALSLLRDQSPSDIRLQGARVRLRFAADGHLLTQLPKGKKGAPAQVPTLHIENGELTLDQEHRPPMILRGLTADIGSAENGLTLTGTITDTFWGNWKTHGNVDTAGGKSSITLQTDNVAVTMQKLKSIPFIPPSVWQEGHVEGTTPATVQLALDTSGDKPQVCYKIEIAPQDAHVQVPSIDLDAVQTSGKAIVADEIVTLDNVHGKTAGGAITLTSARLNFRDEPTTLAFKAGVHDVILHDLPPSWKVPRNLDGKLTGSADLVVTIKNGKVETAGTGEGVIRDARVLGYRVDKPIQLAMRSDGRRFHFHRPKPAALSEKKPDQPSSALLLPPNQRSEPTQVSRYGPDDGPALVKPVPDKEKDKREPAETGNLLQEAPAELVNVLGCGIKWTADGLAHGIDATAKALDKLKPPSKPDEEPTYLDVDLSLKDVDVAQLVQKLNLNLPYPVTGRLTFQVHASIPVNTASDLKAYKLRGSAKLPTFTIDGLEMTNAEAKVNYANGVLNLEELHGQLPQPKDAKTVGKFDGKARVQVVPRGDLDANLKLERIPVGAVLSLVPQAKGTVSGVLSGDVQARAPLEKLSDPATWRGSANLTAPALEVYGLAVSKASVRLNVDDAAARLTTFQAEIDGTPLTGKGELQLTGDYRFNAEAHLGRTDLAALNRLSPSLRPPIEIKGRAKLDGKVKGTLKPFAFDTEGDFEASDVIAEGFKVDVLAFGWSKDENGIRLKDVRADLYGGTVRGSARVPLDATAAGSADLHLGNVDMKAVAKSLPSFPVRLEGKVSGSVKGELAPAPSGQKRSWTTDVKLTAPQLRIQGIPAEKLTGGFKSHGDKIRYDLKGETLGGTFSLKGSLPEKKQEQRKTDEPVGRSGPDLLPMAAFAAARQPAGEEPPGHGRLVVSNARLSRLWAAYNITGALSHLNGGFFLDLPYRHEGPDLFPVGTGTFRIVDIRWDDEALGNSLSGDARLTANELQLYNVSGDVANGLFQGRFVFGLKANSRSWFQFDLQQAEASRLLLPLPAVAAHVKGPVDLSLRGSIGREWDGGGGITLVRGQIYGMEITEWRLPVTFSFSPNQGTGELTVRDSQARVAQGRARFEATLNWGNALRLTGRLLFYQVDLRTLLRHTPEVSAYASGRVSGRVDLAGSEMRSINDLTARVQARMIQGQALQMPVLRQITPYLRPGVSSATFQSGNLKGRLAGGIFRIEHASLIGDFLKLLITGTVNLAGNLNLDVIAQTGLYCLNPTRTNSIGSRIPILGAIPRLLLYEASALLAAQVVHLQVTGTVRSPNIHLEPIIQLTEEAIRFFFNRAIGLDIPNLP